MVTVAAIALGRDRPAGGARRARARARGGLVLVLAGAARAPGPARHRARARRAVIYTHLHPGLARHLRALGRSRSPRSSAPARRSGSTLGSARAGELRPGAVSPAGCGWLGGLARRVDGRRDRPVLRGHEPRRPHRGVDPLHPRAGRHRRTGVPCSARRSARPSCRRRARAPRPCSSRVRAPLRRRRRTRPANSGRGSGPERGASPGLDAHRAAARPATRRARASAS